MSMDMDQNGTVVQTELPSDEYERFRRVADEQDLSLKAALRAAAEEYAERHGGLNPDDPFFDLDLPPVPEDAEPLDPRKTDEYIYGDE